MKHTIKRSLHLFIAFVLVVGLFPAAAFATHEANPQTNCSTIVGEYTFVSNEGFTPGGPSVERTHTFAYNDEWFMGPASTFNQHLATLSAIACETSTSYYPAADERDNTNNSKNVIPFLEALAFEDVAVNAEYNLENMPNTTGVAVGHKTIKDPKTGEEYTVLAIVPRSAGYKQEWDGNFTVGSGSIHQGFKAGRDEILRFVKQYVSEHGIAGDIKVWTCGHSRGGALANLVGAFFAAGGASHYLNGVTVAPENVYAYTFATPTNVLESGATKADLLSVEGGPRTSQDARYENDTPGDAAPYTGADAGEGISPHEGPFAGIHNTVPDFDLITLLPPSSWGFTHFGNYFELTDGSREAYLAALADLDPFAYIAYVGNESSDPPIKPGDETIFGYKTFDIQSISFIDDPNPPASGITQAQFFAQRVKALIYHAPTHTEYANGGWQDTLTALAGVFGMNEKLFATLDVWAPEQPEGARANTIKAVAFSYLAYAAERLAEERGITDENEAAALALEDAIEFITGKPIDPATYTVDDLLCSFAQFLVDGADATFKEIGGIFPFREVETISFKSKTAETIFNAISNVVVNAIPSEYEAYIDMFIPGYSTMTPEQKKEAAGKFVFGYMNGCINGKGTPDEPDPDRDTNAQENINTLFGMCALFFRNYPELNDVIGRHKTAPATELLKAVLPLLKDDPSHSLGDAADGYLKTVLNQAETTILNSGRYDAGSPYYQDIQNHFTTMRDHVTQLRRLLMYLVLYTEGAPFSTENNMRTASTLIAQANKVSSAHYNEDYLAWMLAKDSAYPAHLHQLVHTVAVPETCTEDGHTEYWQCSICGIYFADEKAAQEIDLGDTVIKAHGHKWGPWKVTKEPTTTAEGEETRVCEHDSNHKETRPIPKIKKATPSKTTAGTADAIGPQEMGALAGLALVALVCALVAARRRKLNDE